MFHNSSIFISMKAVDLKKKKILNIDKLMATLNRLD